MAYNNIENKKPFYKVKAHLREHLRLYSRLMSLPISYTDLSQFDDLIPIYDNEGKETLWYQVVYRREEMDNFKKSLITVYENLVSEGDTIPFLRVESIDYCSFGNSKPFRVKIVNEINDNHDYFYVKQADSSRIYGLELEEIFSPDKVNFMVDKNTLIEDHIVGVPVDEFILKKKNVKIDNRLRLAKEFVKFNERCFVRLLGDMRAYNFVVEIIQDFDNVQYRLRAMDFDQQSFEGRVNIYKPQFYKDNKELVALAQELITTNTANQYAREERVAMKKRYLASRQRTKSLLRRMKKDQISSNQNILTLRKQMAKFHQNEKFLSAKSMGDILNWHLELSLGTLILSSASSV